MKLLWIGEDSHFVKKNLQEFLQNLWCNWLIVTIWKLHISVFFFLQFVMLICFIFFCVEYTPVVKFFISITCGSHPLILCHEIGWPAPLQEYSYKGNHILLASLWNHHDDTCCHGYLVLQHMPLHQLLSGDFLH